ncbi:sugar-binding transcriptional regulator [Terrisporobacter mayombei]|uniref:Central glycolytic genes regulator n=1 Tax=Terrisporobacter mayombei TaxID=1541 RepID=A0ABY9Q5L8_9FIRM|nr:sugar-binding domain-containing protein [Terrisporobacter mayombei]MCC3868977.1 transcriptional regulator [Terrisporobacter mayombei]WMT82889.1 Central glycolytic genes regulator [Terrisporobacter mayombei]
MKNLLKIQQKLIPEVIDIMTKRYLILREISLSEPIGRRALATNLQSGERIIRSETELLKKQGLIDVNLKGMTITEEGKEILSALKESMNDVIGLNSLQEELRQVLGIKKVLLIPGSYEKNNSLLKDIGKQASKYFLSVLKDDDIVSIAGGSTMLEFAKSIKCDKKFSSTVVVPARGSVGLDVETQSNNVVAEVSKNIHSTYKLLNIPDELGEESIKTLTQEPEINKTLKLIQNSNVLVFSIGRADEMVKRRKLSDEKAKEIMDKEAIGEAFGHYFNKKGEIVYKLNTVGIDMESFKNKRETIAVFAGRKKAEAFIPISKLNKNIVLVTDEDSARRILELTVNN